MVEKKLSVHGASIPCQKTLYVSFLKTVSQNRLDCISAHTHFKHFRGRGHATRWEILQLL